MNAFNGESVSGENAMRDANCFFLSSWSIKYFLSVQNDFKF